jgi:hypothetical protein
MRADMGNPTIRGVQSWDSDRMGSLSNALKSESPFFIPNVQATCFSKPVVASSSFDGNSDSTF